MFCLEKSNIDDISCCVDTASDAFPQLLNFPNCARLAMGIVSDEELAHVSNLCWKNITTMSDIVTSFPCLKMIGPDREDLSRCWETVIGQELFQLLIIDILIEIFVSIFVLEWIRALLVYTGGCRCCKKFATWVCYVYHLYICLRNCCMMPFRWAMPHFILQIMSLSLFINKQLSG